MARSVQLGLLAAGATLLIALVRAIGVESLRAQLQALGLAFAGVVALEIVLDACNTLGWRWTLPPGAVGFRRLFWVRQAGTAINQLTPTATLGGEVVKAMLLRTHVPSADAVVSIVAAKLSFALAQTALVLLGLATVLARSSGSSALRTGLLVACAATCVGVGGFLVLQRRGRLVAALDVLPRLGVRSAWLRDARARAQALDGRLAALHRERPGAFAASVAWHFVAQLVGTTQLFYLLRSLGTAVGVPTCLALEALAVLVDSAFFFVPARVGVQEGGRVLVFTALGLSATTGLTVAVVVRLNQLAVASLGLAAFAYFSFTGAPATGSVGET